MLYISGANSDPGSRVHPPVLLAAGQPGRCPPQPAAHPLTLPHRLPPPGIQYYIHTVYVHCCKSFGGFRCM